MSEQNIKLKAIGGFIFLFFVMSLAIFLPAWSLSFWQGWVYLLIFFGSSLFITIYLMKNDPTLLEGRVKSGPAAEKEKNQKIIQSFASLFFVSMLVIPGFAFRYHWSEVPVYLIIISDCFVGLGFLIVFKVFKANSFASGTIEVSSEQKLITTGPYKIVRHPMYSGGILLCLFTPISLGSYIGLISAFGVSVVIIFRLLDEEKILSLKLEGYKEYCGKVKYRLIPKVW